MTDAWAIVWKEWREVVGQRGLRGQTGILLNIGVFGVVLPWQFGAPWVTSPLTALMWAWVPMYLVMMVISDAFAGERERHTLEALLATRLSDGAILFGKMAAALAYSAVITVVSLVLGLVTVNLTSRAGGFLMYSASSLVAMLVFGVLLAVLVAAAGILVSLRAATVRQAEQTLGGLIILAMIVPFAGARMIPSEWKSWLLAPDLSALRAIAVVILLGVIDMVLVRMAIRRFQRSRLVADGVVD